MSDDFEVDVHAIQRAKDMFENGDWAGCHYMLELLLKAKRRCGEDEWHGWAVEVLMNRARKPADALHREVITAWRAGEYADRASMDTYMRERAADLISNELEAHDYLYASDNREACMESLGGVPTGNRGIDWVAMAVAALLEDVREDLFDDHIQGDTEPLQVRNGWCDTCESWKPENPKFPLGEYVCSECSVP